MKKITLMRLIAFTLVLTLAFSLTGFAFAENSEDAFEQEETVSDVADGVGIGYYGATITPMGNGLFYYSIPANDFALHTGWFVEFALSLQPDQTITSATGYINAGDAINFYFKYIY